MPGKVHLHLTLLSAVESPIPRTRTLSPLDQRRKQSHQFSEPQGSSDQHPGRTPIPVYEVTRYEEPWKDRVATPIALGITEHCIHAAGNEDDDLLPPTHHHAPVWTCPYGPYPSSTASPAASVYAMRARLVTFSPPPGCVCGEGHRPQGYAGQGSGVEV